MIDNYLNDDARALVDGMSPQGQAWAWQVIEALRARYTAMDQWTTGGQKFTYTDLRFGRRKLGKEADCVFFQLRYSGGRPICSMARWISEDLLVTPSMDLTSHPQRADIEAWLDEHAERVGAYPKKLQGEARRPIDYVATATAGGPVEVGPEAGPNDHAQKVPALNSILFGPPGTGKTYATIEAALEVLDPALMDQYPDLDRASASERLERRKVLKGRFDELARAGRVRFVTFHQSFSYEDFVEGIRAETQEDGALSYPVVDGVFKELCIRAAAVPRSGNSQAKTTDGSAAGLVRGAGSRVWKMSLGTAVGDEAYVYGECMGDGLALLGYGHGLDYTGCKTRADVVAKLRAAGFSSDDYDYAATSVNNFINKMKIGDVLVVSEGNTKFRAIGEVTGNYRHLNRDDHYCQSRSVRWIRQFEPSLAFSELMNNRFSQMTLYELRDGSIDLGKLDALLAPVLPDTSEASEPYVLVIDEINRGNVSRIFGELITLLEPSKRAGASEALSVTLPYSKMNFSVPANVHLVGTMNTADRSLAGIDIALRRRFLFREMPPQPWLLKEVVVDGVNVGELLIALNERIEVLLNREHLLGHAYFMRLAEPEQNTLPVLAEIFRNQVLPLLQEYFFEDWERIGWVLNDSSKDIGHRFLLQQGLALEQLFAPEVADKLQDRRWSINPHAFDRIESFAGILRRRDL